MLAEFPEITQLALANAQKASCLARLGDLDQAVAFYLALLKPNENFLIRERWHFTILEDLWSRIK